MSNDDRMRVNDEVVVDVTKPLTFTVTDADVKTGQSLKSRDCPGNHGVHREMQKVCPALTRTEVRVHQSRTYIRLPAKIAEKEFGARGVPPVAKFVWARFLTPQRLAREVISMDRHEIFHAGEYKIVPVGASTSSRLAAQRRTKKNAEKMKDPYIAKRPYKARREMVGVRKFGANR